MIYQAYQAQVDMMTPVRAFARAAAANLRTPAPFGVSELPATMHAAAAFEMLSRAGLSHTRPAFNITSVNMDGVDVPVTEEAAMVTPFCTLLHFRKEVPFVRQPKVLLVAPMSGHFATLLRDTVATMLPANDVYLTDWHNARDIPLRAGRFGVDEHTDHVIGFMEHLGPGSHLVAVCQPGPQALVATALMAEDKNPALPRSLTIMAGPIDVRVNPTVVDDLAADNPIEWFERNVIGIVPWRYKGAGRRVYPGFVQLGAFLNMNLDRHVQSHFNLYSDLAAGETAAAEKTKEFYDEYFAVSDLPAEFYLETVQQIFQESLLPKGEFTHRGRPINLDAIRTTALLTVEGERDDICAVGQTMAAHDLCKHLPDSLHRHHLQAGVGHFGVFSGRRWQHQVYPNIEQVILETS
ncbi:MAG: polyhydroxyalkanoate depolymerase [Dehalococcoidia bacterium]|nr:polyhydroxyalkanoate depolymerase [Dehalococcoidia bacterium]MCA9844600.1 polyhydroxyalkanoate depolymerase [Dehalococcoidia bacterium]MCA9852090.1 polyhydroxyalkanoate depolymerase [Dehalococcoidia bacterium]